MAWWEYVITAMVLLAGICAFLVLTGSVTRFLSSRTDRTAENMYGDYADSLRKQRKYARRHGGQSQDEETRSDKVNAPQPKAPNKAA